MIRVTQVSIIMLLIMSNLIAQNNSSEKIMGNVFFPFTMDIDPMERLLLINFEKDPDSVYIGFEPQLFNDPFNGSGHLIIGWRRDRKIDVYHQKSLNPNPLKYSIAGAGLNEMIPTDMETAFFEVNDFGVQAYYRFNDLMGRAVEIAIQEKNPKTRKPFGLLAPMGDAAIHPTSLPLILLHDFYFVRKKHTTIRLTIAHRFHKVDQLPIRMDGTKMTFVRYSPQPLIATLNANYEGTLKGFEAEIGHQIVETDDYIFEIHWSNQTAFIQSMSVKNNIHLISMAFNPAFPCLSSIAENSSHQGEFTITGHNSVGSISGFYSIQSNKESTHIRLVPSMGWKPKTTKLSTRFLFTVAKVFRKWPTTYQWDAEIHKEPQGEWYMESKWKRSGKILQ